MKSIKTPTCSAKRSSRESAAHVQREPKARYRRLFETEEVIPAAVPHRLQSHLAESLLMLDLLDLARDLAANVIIPRAEIAAFDQIALAQIRRSFHIASRWTDQFLGITHGRRELIVQGPSKSSGTTLKATPGPTDLSAKTALRSALVKVRPSRSANRPTRKALR